MFKRKAHLISLISKIVYDSGSFQSNKQTKFLCILDSNFEVFRLSGDWWSTSGVHYVWTTSIRTSVSDFKSSLNDS